MESHENPQSVVGVLPEEPRLPTSANQTVDSDVELVLGNVRTPDAPVSSRLRSATGTRLLLGPAH